MPLWVEATTESLRLGHSSYDLFYCILARRTGATLFTLDRALIELCDKEGIDCLHKVALTEVPSVEVALTEAPPIEATPAANTHPRESVSL